jgi:hypothetical protein
MPAHLARMAILRGGAPKFGIFSAAVLRVSRIV